MSSSSPKTERKSWSLGRLSVVSRKGSMKPAALELAENAPNAHYAPFSLSAPPTGPRGDGSAPRPPACRDEAAEATVVMNAADYPRPSVNLDPRVSIYSVRRPLLSRSNIQGRVYNFLERPTGWKCFVYHFTVLGLLRIRTTCERRQLVVMRLQEEAILRRPPSTVMV